MPETKRRAEVPPEAIAAYEEKHKEVNRRILDKVASDPDFKERLLDNPSAALQEVGVAQELEEIRNPEVAGHGSTRWWYCCDYWSDWWCC